MNYNFITNPITNRKVSLHTTKGKQILAKYCMIGGLHSALVSLNNQFDQIKMLIKSLESFILLKILQNKFQIWADVLSTEDDPSFGNDIYFIKSKLKELNDEERNYKSFFEKTIIPNISVILHTLSKINMLFQSLYKLQTIYTIYESKTRDYISYKKYVSIGTKLEEIKQIMNLELDDERCKQCESSDSFSHPNSKNCCTINSITKIIRREYDLAFEFYEKAGKLYIADDVSHDMSS